MTSAAIHLPSARRIPIAHSASAFSSPSRTSLITSPTVPEKKPMPARERRLRNGRVGCHGSAGHGVTRWPGGCDAAAEQPPSGICARPEIRARGSPVLRTTQPIFWAMLFWAPMKDFRAGIAPAPFVERTHAAPRSARRSTSAGCSASDAAGGRLAERLQVLVLDLCAVPTCSPGSGRSRARGRLRRGLHHVVRDEVLREALDAVGASRTSSP